MINPLVHDLRPHRVLDPPHHLGARMTQAQMLEQEHPPRLGMDIHPALVVTTTTTMARQKRRGAAVDQGPLGTAPFFGLDRVV